MASPVEHLNSDRPGKAVSKAALPDGPASKGQPSYHRDAIWGVRKLCLFEDLSYSDKSTLASLLGTQRYRPGEFVFHMDEHAEHLYFVGAGMIKVSLISPAGTERILDVFSEGDVFGEMFISPENRRTAAAQALSPSTVHTLAEDDFIRMLQTLPRLCHTFVRHLIEEERRTLMRMEALMNARPGPRLLSVLLELARRMGDHSGNVYILPEAITQADLAGMAALHRSTVSLLINRYRRDRVLGGRGRRLTLEAGRIEEILRQEDLTLC
jgi:CRP/FNR family transcriptional regulator, cyclic AMP receptor protein